MDNREVTTTMTELYIGLMSGTSVNGIDAVLVDLKSQQPLLMGTYQHPIPAEIKKRIFKIFETPASLSLLELGALDNEIGKLFASSALLLLEKYRYTVSDIRAIGCHGQTIFHHPNPPSPVTIQLGNPHLIAEITGITTVADFRRRDLAAGGQGAPLAPLFHEALWRSSKENKVILNIGGIANITILPADAKKKLLGFDTGPGNALLDTWIRQHQKQSYDDEGNWALTGKVDKNLLEILLREPYFQLAPPKSTGKELFNLTWLRKKLKERKTALSPNDVQATLLELTAETIRRAISFHAEADASIYVCGGGVYNKALLFALAQKLFPRAVLSTEDLHLAPLWVEATTFAWLAKMALMQEPLNVSSVTGAKHLLVLGCVFWK